MIDATFRFYLKKDDSTFYYVENNVVQTISTPTPLQNDPDGWSSIDMKYVSNVEYWGIYRQVTLDLRFVLDGAQILRHVFFNESFEGAAILVIEKRNTEDGSYSFWAEMSIDFNSAQSEVDFFSVQAMERGITEFIENKRDVPCEIPLSDSNRLRLNVDGLKIYNAVSYTPIGFYVGGISPPTQPTGPINLGQLWRISELGKGFMPESVTFSQGGILRDNYIFKASTDGDVVTLRFANTRIYSQFGAQFLVWRIPAGGGSITSLYSYTLAAGATFDINTTISATLNRNDVITVFFQGTGVSPDPSVTPNNFSVSDVSDTEKSLLEVSGVIQFTPTKCKSYRYFHYGQKLIDKLSEGRYGLVSDFLTNPSTTATTRKANYDNSPWNTVVTSGDGIRDISTAVIKGSLGQFFQDCLSRWPIGIGIEGNNIRIEKIEYWFDKDVELFDCGTNLSNFTVTTASERIFNQINVGYGAYEYDELSGKEEFNAGQSYLLQDVKRVTKTLDRVTPYRADMFGWEFLRNQLSEQATGISQNNTVDNKADNDVFLMEIDPTPVMGFYEPYRPAGFISGLSQVDRVYNVTLSPKRALLRMIPLLKSITKGVVSFQSGDKNVLLNSQFFTTFSVLENASADLTFGADYGAIQPYFQPFEFEFDAPAPTALLQLTSALIKGYVSFTVLTRQGAQQLKGFVIDVGIQPATKDTYRFRLLSHPDNNLENLI